MPTNKKHSKNDKLRLFFKEPVAIFLPVEFSTKNILPLNKSKNFENCMAPN